jgi:glyoxylase-like metal-dependent hydrolase (beta-lactamase superfamily II)
VPHDALQLGAYEVTPLCDGWAPLPLADEIPDVRVDWDAERRRFPWAFPADDPASWAWHVHAFLVRHPEGLALVDTGIGHFARPPYDVPGRIDEELAGLGVAPEDVGDVILTHLHGDHSGATCRPDGAPRFPNATYHVHREDWRFFGEHRTPEDFTGRFAMEVVREAGLLDLDPADRAVRPGVSVVHAPGHTAGHRVVAIGNAGETLLLTGDLLHVPAQVAHPTARSTHDEDAELGARERFTHLERARREGAFVGVSHFARPFGHVTEQGWASD